MLLGFLDVPESSAAAFSSDNEPARRTTAAQPVKVVSARVSTTERLRQVWLYRELLVNLIRKELKVKYKGSAIGFLWTMLNPAMYVGIYYLAFSVFLPNNIPRFPIFLLAGLIVWNLFSGALGAATGSIVGNGSIVGKVSFPREVLPLAAVGANVVHFLLQCVVLLGALAIFQHAPSLSYAPLLIPALLVLLILASGLGIFLAAVNVRYRDTQHLLELAMSAWFWMTPIVYQFARVSTRLDENGLTWLYLMNPITPIVLVFQRVLYNSLTPIGTNGQPEAILPAESAWWYLMHLGYTAAVGVVLLVIGLKVFSRLEGDFAEEL